MLTAAGEFAKYLPFQLSNSLIANEDYFGQIAKMARTSKIAHIYSRVARNLKMGGGGGGQGKFLDQCTDNMLEMY